MKSLSKTYFFIDTSYHWTHYVGPCHVIEIVIALFVYQHFLPLDSQGKTMPLISRFTHSCPFALPPQSHNRVSSKATSSGDFGRCRKPLPLPTMSIWRNLHSGQHVWLPLRLPRRKRRQHLLSGLQFRFSMNISALS